ncbi:DUF3841 domain-containing protein [Alloiococcus sp. CFN-8]|uniref:DUF3841 domain-containing protein n=1 Tax=Alloiococcus sp. CFN-8 TaxID=3416081 RepID=UPI003CED15D5
MKIKLWTLQHKEAYESLAENGILYVNDEHLLYDENFKEACNWMVKQMEKRIGNKPDYVKYPLWAWYEWDGKQKRRDLRCSGYAKPGTPMVQIEFEIEESKILLSDFDDWNFVLNNDYISANDEDYDTFCKELKDKDYEYQDILDLSKQNDSLNAIREQIFKVNEHYSKWNSSSSSELIQATFWELQAEQIIKVEHFIAKQWWN